MAEIEWIDDEVVGMTCDCGYSMLVDIYNWKECPVCKKKYKLKQSTELLEKD